MEIERIIELLKVEQECLKRQEGMDGLQEAYDEAIKLLTVLNDWCYIIGKTLADYGFTSVDQLKAFLKKSEVTNNDNEVKQRSQI